MARTLIMSFAFLTVGGCRSVPVEKGVCLPSEAIKYTSRNGRIEIKPRLKYELILSIHVLQTAEDHHQLFVPWAEQMRKDLSAKTLKDAWFLGRKAHESQLCSLVANYDGPDSIECLTDYIERENRGAINRWALRLRSEPKFWFKDFASWYADFLRRYYREGFEKGWLAEHRQLVYNDAESISMELEKLDFSITEYMEQFTGRKFDNSNKIILYPSSFSRPQHAYGFSENGVKVFLYKVDKGITSVIASGFHELLHSLIGGWEKPQRINENIRKLAKQELFEKTCQELKKSYGYPLGPLEEQLVHSMARYMLYKKGYIDEKQTRRGTYGPYEDALYDVLFDKYDSFDNVDDFIYYALSNIKVVGENKAARFEYTKQ